LTISLAFFMGYIGLMVGAAKGDYLDLSALGGIFSDKNVKIDYRILDTSVIIDGRIADVAETGFLGGTLIIPHFILAELQQVADSPDSSKRQRGRRGLDMLQRLRNNSKLDIQIVETDFPAVKEVDLKLIELGKQLAAKIQKPFRKFIRELVIGCLATDRAAAEATAKGLKKAIIVQGDVSKPEDVLRMFEETEAKLGKVIGACKLLWKQRPAQVPAAESAGFSRNQVVLQAMSGKDGWTSPTRQHNLFSLPISLVVSLQDRRLSGRKALEPFLMHHYTIGIIERSRS